jgi:hypothetical protein
MTGRTEMRENADPAEDLDADAAAVFLAVCDQPLEQRRVSLVKVAGPDTPLHDRVSELLGAYDRRAELTVDQVFMLTCDLPQKAREGVLDRLVPAGGVRAEVDAMLAEPVSLEDEARDSGVEEVTPQKLGHYMLTAKLGKGSFGEVWAARDTLMCRDVALKLFLPTARPRASPQRGLPRGQGGQRGAQHFRRHRL